MAAKKASRAGGAKVETKAAPSREELLELIWDAQATATLKAIESGDASAAMLGVGRAFLADNGITLDTLRTIRWRNNGLSPLGPAGTGHLKLPTFDDDDDDSNDPALKRETDDPLRTVPAFAPPADDTTTN